MVYPKTNIINIKNQISKIYYNTSDTYYKYFVGLYFFNRNLKGRKTLFLKTLTFYISKRITNHILYNIL